MSATKDGKNWRCQFYYTDWQGVRHKKNKRGFKTKGEAEQWERNFLEQRQSDLSIGFENFLQIYYNDVGCRLRANTMRTKHYIVDMRILPYFRKKKVSEIRASDIRAWQNQLLREGYSPTYLKTVNSQLSAIFNYAVRYYDLRENPCQKAGSIGKSSAEEKNFWTQQEFLQFLSAYQTKPKLRMAFTILFWTGMRIGELLALTYADIDLEKSAITINKSYQRLNRTDVITPPKTPKSNRVVTIPPFLVQEFSDYVSSLTEFAATDRVFPYTESHMEHEIVRGVQRSGVKRIRLHDLRHSHASLLVEMGLPPLLIADRLGHEKVETTLNTYSHLYPNKQNELAGKLELEHQNGGVRHK